MRLSSESKSRQKEQQAGGASAWPSAGEEIRLDAERETRSEERWKCSISPLPQRREEAGSRAHPFCCVTGLLVSICHFLKTARKLSQIPKPVGVRSSAEEECTLQEVVVEMEQTATYNMQLKRGNKPPLSLPECTT